MSRPIRASRCEPTDSNSRPPRMPGQREAVRPAQPMHPAMISDPQWSGGPLWPGKARARALLTQQSAERRRAATRAVAEARRGCVSLAQRRSAACCRLTSRRSGPPRTQMHMSALTRCWQVSGVTPHVGARMPGSCVGQEDAVAGGRQSPGPPPIGSSAHSARHAHCRRAHRPPCSSLQPLDELWECGIAGSSNSALHLAHCVKLMLEKPLDNSSTGAVVQTDIRTFYDKIDVGRAVMEAASRGLPPAIAAAAVRHQLLPCIQTHAADVCVGQLGRRATGALTGSRTAGALGRVVVRALAEHLSVARHASACTLYSGYFMIFASYVDTLVLVGADVSVAEATDPEASAYMHRSWGLELPLEETEAIVPRGALVRPDLVRAVQRARLLGHIIDDNAATVPCWRHARDVVFGRCVRPDAGGAPRPCACAGTATCLGWGFMARRPIQGAVMGVLGTSSGRGRGAPKAVCCARAGRAGISFGGSGRVPAATRPHCRGSAPWRATVVGENSCDRRVPVARAAVGRRPPHFVDRRGVSDSRPRMA